MKDRKVTEKRREWEKREIKIQRLEQKAKGREGQAE